MSTLSQKIDNQTFGFNKASMATVSSSSDQGDHESESFFDSLNPLSGFDFKQTPVSNETLMDIANNTLLMTLDNIMPLGSFAFSPIDQGFDVANFSERLSKTLDNLYLSDKMVGGNAGTEVWELLKDVPLGLENVAVTELSNTQRKLGQSLYGETVDLLLTNPKHLDDYAKKYGIEDAVQPDTSKSALNTGGEYLTNRLVDGIEALVDDPKKVIKDFGNSLVDLAKLGNDYIKSNTLVGVVTSLQQGDIAGIVESYYRVEPVKEGIVNELKSLTKGYGNLGLLPHLASRVATGAVAAPVGLGITAATVKVTGKGASHASKALAAASRSVLPNVLESAHKALPVVKKKIPLIPSPVIFYADTPKISNATPSEKEKLLLKRYGYRPSEVTGLKYDIQIKESTPTQRRRKGQEIKVASLDTFDTQNNVIIPNKNSDASPKQELAGNFFTKGRRLEVDYIFTDLNSNPNFTPKPSTFVTIPKGSPLAIFTEMLDTAITQFGGADKVKNITQLLPDQDREIIQDALEKGQPLEKAIQSTDSYKTAGALGYIHPQLKLYDTRWKSIDESSLLSLLNDHDHTIALESKNLKKRIRKGILDENGIIKKRGFQPATGVSGMTFHGSVEGSYNAGKNKFTFYSNQKIDELGNAYLPKNEDPDSLLKNPQELTWSYHPAEKTLTVENYTADLGVPEVMITNAVNEIGDLDIVNSIAFQLTSDDLPKISRALRDSKSLYSALRLTDSSEVAENLGHYNFSLKYRRNNAWNELPAGADIASILEDKNIIFGLDTRRLNTGKNGKTHSTSPIIPEYTRSDIERRQKNMSTSIERRVNERRYNTAVGGTDDDYLLLRKRGFISAKPTGLHFIEPNTRRQNSNNKPIYELGRKKYHIISHEQINKETGEIFTPEFSNPNSRYNAQSELTWSYYAGNPRTLYVHDYQSTSQGAIEEMITKTIGDIVQKRPVNKVIQIINFSLTPNEVIKITSAIDEGLSLSSSLLKTDSAIVAENLGHYKMKLVYEDQYQAWKEFTGDANIPSILKDNSIKLGLETRRLIGKINASSSLTPKNHYEPVKEKYIRNDIERRRTNVSTESEMRLSSRRSGDDPYSTAPPRTPP